VEALWLILSRQTMFILEASNNGLLEIKIVGTKHPRNSMEFGSDWVEVLLQPTVVPLMEPLTATFMLLLKLSKNLTSFKIGVVLGN